MRTAYFHEDNDVIKLPKKFREAAAIDNGTLTRK